MTSRWSRASGVFLMLDGRGFILGIKTVFIYTCSTKKIIQAPAEDIRIILFCLASPAEKKIADPVQFHLKKPEH